MYLCTPSPLYRRIWSTAKLNHEPYFPDYFRIPGLTNPPRIMTNHDESDDLTSGRCGRWGDNGGLRGVNGIQVQVSRPLRSHLCVRCRATAF